MDLGCFSVSLTVKDLDASLRFYEALGFEVTGGSPEQNYLILMSGATVVGLFHGMFDRNILTFNPGLDAGRAAAGNLEPLSEYLDVREIQRTLKERGIELQDEVDAETTGPGHITLSDPDGNPILIDQFF